jgi:hypothetical protein
MQNAHGQNWRMAMAALQVSQRILWEKAAPPPALARSGNALDRCIEAANLLAIQLAFVERSLDQLWDSC